MRRGTRSNVHAKDTRIDADKLYALGNLGLNWHTAKLPGLGNVEWGQLFSALTDAGYQGAVCIEVEDRAFEGSVADRLRASSKAGGICSSLCDRPEIRAAGLVAGSESLEEAEATSQHSKPRGQALRFVYDIANKLGTPLCGFPRVCFSCSR